jgi:hypothetical protein
VAAADAASAAAAAASLWQAIKPCGMMRQGDGVCGMLMLMLALCTV